MSKTVGILTAGGDTPGLNAAIRAVGKSGILNHDLHIIGFLDGFRGLIENRTVQLPGEKLSGILTIGGTILGTSRDKPHKMTIGNKVMDMTDVAAETYQKNHLDVLVCCGGGGTAKNANRLAQKGLNIITLPKTIDNDIAGTDVTFGFDTAMGIATEAIDRLHSTAHSHHRIIVVEVMGHRAGWLALGAGLSGGADVILIPEIPYDVNLVAESIRKRSRKGSRFSIVAVAEGAMSRQKADAHCAAVDAVKKAETDESKKQAKAELAIVKRSLKNSTLELSQQLEELTGLESRVTILGHVQRGGTPSAYDRLLATQLGTKCTELIMEGTSGVMVASISGQTQPVPLDSIAGKNKLVPIDHSWVKSARDIGVCVGDC